MPFFVIITSDWNWKQKMFSQTKKKQWTKYGYNKFQGLS